MSLQAHDEVCPKFPLTCDGCGKKKIPREKVSSFPAPPGPAAGGRLGRGPPCAVWGVTAWARERSSRLPVWGRRGCFAVTLAVMQTSRGEPSERCGTPGAPEVQGARQPRPPCRPLPPTAQLQGQEQDPGAVS